MGALPQRSSLAPEGGPLLPQVDLGLQRGPAKTLHASLPPALAETLHTKQAVNSSTRVSRPITKHHVAPIVPNPIVRNWVFFSVAC